MSASAFTWDKKFISLAKEVASWSKDRSTKVGCVIVGPKHDVRALGYNGFPRGANDCNEVRHTRPLKYKWTEHAERNALYNALLSGTSVEGCTAYLQWHPCTDCARGLIQSGIAEVVCTNPADDKDNAKWGEDLAIAAEMLAECGVTVRYVVS
jgi:dCMP deaminase